jgi:hypothetical protein
LRIPSKLKTCRYYVAISSKEALSSWKTGEEAEASLGRLVLFNPEVALRVKGIMVVDSDGKYYGLEKPQFAG